MPDHQIVIKLDSDQFDEAQRLAKAAGFRSASSFIRDRIVSLIKQADFNPDSLLEVFPELPKKIRKIDNDILRIQNELQIFISESEQSNQDFNSNFQESFEVALKPDQDFPIFSDQVGATFDPNQNPETSQKEEPIETVTESNVKPKNLNLKEQKLPEPDQDSNDKEKNVWRSANEAVDLTDEKEEQNQESESELQTDAVEIKSPQIEETDENSTKISTSKTSNTPDISEVLEAVDEANDELEEMADRAFSISPRLGAIEPKPNQIEEIEDDPLADLLDEHLVDKMVSESDTQMDQDDSHQSESSSLAEEEKPQEEPSEAEEEETTPQKDDEETSAEEENDDQKEEVLEADKEETEEEEEEEGSPIPNLNKEPQPEAEKPKHDITGGPPPKKRKK